MNYQFAQSTDHSQQIVRLVIRRSLHVVTIAFLGSVIGCGNGLAEVRGKVTLDGESISGGENIRGTIYFYPEGGTGTPAVSLLDSEGRYRVATGTKSGVAPGTYNIAISATQIIPSNDPNNPPSGRPLTDRRFSNPRQSGLKAEVGPGSNEFDFDVEKIKPAKKRRRRR